MIDGNINFVGSLSGSIEGGGGEGTNNYNELINKPSINGVSLVGNKTTSQLSLFDGDYTNLTNKPSINGTTLNGAQTSQTLGIFDGDYNNLTNKPSIPSGDYDDLIDKPSINNVTLAGNRTAHDLGLFDGDYNNLTNKPNLAEVATTGSYDDLNNKPTIPPAQVNTDWNASSGVAQILNKPSLATVATSGSYEDLTNKPTIPPAQVNTDWDASSGVAQILNKPSLATVATTGNYTDLINKPTADDIQYDTNNSVADEISELNSSLTQKQDTLTVSSTSLTSDQTPNPFSSGVTGYINLVKYGRVVCVTAVIKATSATTNLDICILPSGYRPHATNVWLSSDFYGDTSGCEFRVITDGKVNCAIPSGSINKDIKVSGSFIASN